MNSPDNPRVEQQEIDASAKWPVLVIYSQALAWLLIGGALQLIAAIQLHTPSFLGVLAGCEWFTHGRIAAAAANALVYGWGFNAAFGFALWLMARLSAAAFRSGGWAIVACKAWNIGLGLGLLGIFLGGSTSYALLEMPRFITLFLLGAYLLMGVWAVTTFSVRNTENVFASQWYILGAVFFFPWLYLGAQIMLFDAPVRGVVQAVVNAWYVNGLYGLWFVPMALAAFYYFMPKITGKPLANYYKAHVAFWWFVVCTAFAAGTRLIGGPVPAWISSLGIVANYVVVPAIIIIVVNLRGAFCMQFAAMQRSLTLRFMMLGFVGFVFWSVLNLLLSFRGIAATAQFTMLMELRDWLAFYACFSSAMFGAAYFILPRVTGQAWRSSALVHIHFACAAMGVLIMLGTLAYAGWTQGHLLNTASVQFKDILTELTPFFVLRSFALILLFVGHVAFLINYVWLALATAVCPASSEPAVFVNPPAMEGPRA